MERQVGLARFRFATAKTIPTTITRSNNNTPSTSGSNTIAPSTNFLTNKPCLSGGTYYFWTKANQTVTFNSNPSDVNHWKEAVNINLAAGAYTADNDIVTVQDYRCNWICTGTATYTFSYNTNKQPYELVANDLGGTYTMQCWGACGGIGLYHGSATAYDNKGLGGYAKGSIVLESARTLYIYVGGKGTNGIDGSDASGGWNGGGNGCDDQSDDESGGGGGGATDIRLTSGTWNSFASLKSRIMVAGGGGGGAFNSYGGHGGGLEGTYYVYNYATATVTLTQPGTQTSGYKFGIGENAQHYKANVDQGGGGGGYYGAKAFSNTNYSYICIPGSGGSGFVSGLTGCVAIDVESTENNIIQSSATDKTVHYSGLKFTNAELIAGSSTDAVMPNPSGGANIKGRADHGYCKIVLTH